MKEISIWTCLHFKATRCWNYGNIEKYEFQECEVEIKMEIMQATFLLPNVNELDELKDEISWMKWTTISFEYINCI